MPENLWGDLKSLPIVRTPVAVLKEQAELLTQLTNGLIVGWVGPSPSSLTRGFAWSLGVRVPSLNDYSVELLEIDHPPELYPVMMSSQIASKAMRNIPDEQVLKDFVKQILQSQEVRQLIGGLLSQTAE